MAKERKEEQGHKQGDQGPLYTWIVARHTIGTARALLIYRVPWNLLISSSLRSDIGHHYSFAISAVTASLHQMVRSEHKTLHEKKGKKNKRRTEILYVHE